MYRVLYMVMHIHSKVALPAVGYNERQPIVDRMNDHIPKPCSELLGHTTRTYDVLLAVLQAHSS